MTKGAQASQQAVLQVMGRALESADQALQALAQNPKTDEVQLEIAKITVQVGEQGLELARIGERMNKDNNNFWWQIWGTTATATVALASVALFVFSGGRGNVPKA